MAAKAILRIEKIKTLGNLSASSSHVARTRHTPNSDPASIIFNKVLIGSLHPLSDVEKLLPEKRRKNAVLAVEHVLTASPEFFKNKSHEEIMEWAKKSVESMKEFWSEENIANATLHLDESTPHLHLYAVPIDHKSGRLNARGFIGGREKMRHLQDHYASDMSVFRLKRGVKGSKAKHTRVKEFYQHLNNPPSLKYVEAEVVVRENGFGVLRQKTEIRKFPSWSSAQAVQTLASETVVMKKKAHQYQETAKSLERENAKLERDKLREIPLTDLALELGLVRDKDRTRKGQR